MLHWTKPSQNWNTQCAECHSTNLRKGYDAERDVYETTWSDLDVACEACHGPGSAHVAWAERAGAGAANAEGELGLSVRLPRPRPGDWILEPDARIARRAVPRADHAELETCAPCHARRSTLREGRLPGEPLLDTHRPSLLEPGLYEADGQMRDEVYEYGSFLQSRMYAAGVTCSDCHDPHSLAAARGRQRRLRPVPPACGLRHPPRITTTRPAPPARSASPATCRRAPTW